MTPPNNVTNRYPNVSRETWERLTIYHDLLIKWNKSINLIAKPDDIWNRHFADSLQLLKFFSMDKPNPLIIDIGSGGGFPGLILAIVGAGRLHLAESDKRKCEFLKHVSRETKCDVTIHNTRVEEIEISGVDFITSRACASLTDLLYLTQHLWQADTVGLFHKGKRYAEEIAEAQTKQSFHVKHFPSETDPDGVILEVQGLCKTPHLISSPSSTKKVE